jgi:hypothetical protein
MKRQWGFNYIITKRGINRASADVGFMFIAYNLKRIFNILGQDLLKEYLRILIPLFSALIDCFRRKISRFTVSLFQTIICGPEIQLSLKSF